MCTAPRHAHFAGMLDDFSAYYVILHALAPAAIRERGVRRGSPNSHPFPQPAVGRVVRPVPRHRYIEGWLTLRDRPPAIEPDRCPAVGASLWNGRHAFSNPTNVVLLREAIAVRPDAPRKGRRSKTVTASMWRCSRAQAHVQAKPSRTKWARSG